VFQKLVLVQGNRHKLANAQVIKSPGFLALRRAAQLHAVLMILQLERQDA
jgi:hypothetical protein